MTPSKSLSRLIALALAWGSPMIALATEATGLKQEVAQQARAQEAKVIAWRRDIHAHPELGNQEQRTSRGFSLRLPGLALFLTSSPSRHGPLSAWAPGVGHSAQEGARARRGMMPAPRRQKRPAPKIPWARLVASCSLAE